MLLLRSLILFFIALEPSAWAAEQSLSLGASADESTNTGVGLSSSSFPTRNMGQSLRYQMKGWGSWSYGAGVFQYQHDYRAFEVRDIQNVARPLSEVPVGETQASAELGYAWGPWEIRAGHLSTVNSGTPFRTRRSETSLAWRGEDQGSQVTLRGQFQEIDQPESFFQDSSFRMQARPRWVSARQIQIEWDQILNSKTRTSLAMGFLQKPQERPSAYDLAARLNYALSTRFFSTFEARKASENRAEALLDEKGYFDVTSGTLGLTFEPIYDFLVSATYSFTEEAEDRPAEKIRAGSAQYGVGFRYSFFPYEMNVQGASVQSPVRGNGLMAQGDFVWAF